MENINNLDIPVERRIRMFAGQVYAAAGIGMWCFGMDKHLFYSTSPNATEFRSFLELDNCLETAVGKEGGWNRPILLSDSLNLMWVAEHLYNEQEEPTLLILMGPFFFSKTSLQQIENALREKVSSIYVRRQMMRVLSSVPTLNWEMVCQYVLMMHYTLTDQMIRTDEFLYQDDFPQEEQLSGKLSQLVQTKGEEVPIAADRVETIEKTLLGAVKDGNLKILDLMAGGKDAAISVNQMVSNTGDALRDGKNTVLIFEALCNRAAKEGGLPAQTALEMEHRYVAEIERCTTVTKLVNLNLKMIEDYVQHVHAVKNQSDISPEILESCDYIKTHVNDSLSVEYIAMQAGYTPYYFTKKFYKEMGVRVTDYIKQARIEYAKIALITTRKGVQELSEELQFGTRNYFCKVFKEIVGMTPTAYKEKHWKEQRK